MDNAQLRLFLTCWLCLFFADLPAFGGVVKTVNGLAIASVKTVDGLAIASVKTINGADSTSGPNAYFDAAATSDSVISFGGGESFIEWDDIVVSTGGTLTNLEVNIHQVTANGNIKLGLYDNAGNYVTGATGVLALNTADTHDVYRAVTGLAISIASGTYKLVIQGDATVGHEVNSLISSGKGTYQSGNTYSTFPKASLGSPGGTEGKQLRMRIFVQ